MATDDPPPDNALVRNVRDSMSWTREDLAEFLDISVDTVRKWEDGTNPCAGPAKRLLALLHVWPELPAWLAAAPGRPPIPALVPKGSPPWRGLRQVIRQIRRLRHSDEQEALFFRIGIDQAWLNAAISEGLLKHNESGPQRGLHEATERARVWFDIEWVDVEPLDGDGRVSANRP